MFSFIYMRKVIEDAALRQASELPERDIPVAFEVAWLLAALSQPNHIVPLCSGASLACRLHASSIPLGIDNMIGLNEPN